MAIDNKPEPTYLAYLLRLQLVDNAGQFEWRASLEDPRSREQLHFAGIEELFDFLRVQTAKTGKIDIERRATE